MAIKNRNNRKYIAYCIIFLLVLVGAVWYKTIGTDTAHAVEGKIFICKIGDKGNAKDTGYFVFGGKKNGYGSLFVGTNSRAHIDQLNASGELSNMLSSQSDNYTRFWDTENDGVNIKWVNGLSTDAYPDNVIFHDASMDVQKVSGVFSKKISGILHDTTFDFPPESVTITLTQYATIKN
ncbi:hypothetical protein ACFQ5J_04680 [Lacticaseibacillus baoqingensis]|uniref:Uncharacterized protein n=2 Tax=Lacticaseibacillus baoqingensis TaxID=2486013 RepID=A0ABW4E578_9LACO